VKWGAGLGDWLRRGGARGGSLARWHLPSRRVLGARRLRDHPVIRARLRCLQDDRASAPTSPGPSTGVRASVKTDREERMRESYSEGLASHTGPESCAGVREVVGEALTGATRAGLWSSESGNSGGGRRGRRRNATTDAPLERGTSGPAESKNPGTRGTSLYGNREILWWPTRWSWAEIRKPRRRS
jgi:hypothetical protein